MKKTNGLGLNAGIKAMVIAFLTLLLLLPTFFVSSLIDERQSYRQAAMDDISQKWGSSQSIEGPILSIPYKDWEKANDGTVNEVIRYSHFLPSQLKVQSTVKPEKKHRGIYDVIVYTSNISLKGSFESSSPELLGVNEKNILWERAFITIGISDLRGIRDEVSVNIFGKDYKADPGVLSADISSSGVHVNLNSTNETISAATEFNISLSLRGSDQLYFAPIGKVTEVKVESDWQSPSFTGAFLPERVENQAYFPAKWKVLHLNRNYPQQWLNSSYSIQSSLFGVRLIQPADMYQQSTRSVKYALLLISLTFIMFFFMEYKNGAYVHVIQYLLIGLAICIFYLLLISISEYLGFASAYGIASVLTIGLISLYTVSVIKSRKLALFVGSVLSLLYGFLYIILKSEDYALLMGSLLLFVVLSSIMFYSRNIDWNISSKVLPEQNDTTNDRNIA